MDRMTANQQRMAYAKICVEIEASLEIPRFIEVELRNGSIATITVDIPLLPQKCSHCCIFSHTDKSSPRKPTEVKVWVPKQPLKQDPALFERQTQGDICKEQNAEQNTSMSIERSLR